MITEDAIRALTTSQSYSRGEEYYHAGAVSALVRRGDTLMADVVGSSHLPYRVTADLSEASIVSAACTCPYDWGGYCKHIVAVLLAYIHDQDEVEERPTVDALLANLDPETLLGLLSDMLVRHPELIDWVEGRLAVGSHGVPVPTAVATGRGLAVPRQAPVDAKAIRRQVRSVMRAPGDYYATSGVISGLDEVLQQARLALEAGDGENALVVVGIMAEETIPGWEEHDDSDGEFGDWFGTLGAVFTEALLTADLVWAEREAWARKLETWQAELDDYGVEDAFDAAIAAAEQGWNNESLRRKLAGHFSESDASGVEESWFADALTAARLNVLERQGRIEEYLNLAEAEGEIERYTTMLVKAGRSQEAVDYGLRSLLAPEEALALAAALHQ